MAKISKGFSLTVAILSVVCLIWGICIAFISWLLADKAPTSFTEKFMYGSFSEKPYSFPTYWWGGLGLIIPGILGITVGVTRNVVMVFFLIFDILCFVASLVMSVLAGLVISFWRPFSQYLEGQNGYCIDSSPSSLYFLANQCICRSRYTDTKWILYDVTCDKLKGIGSMLVALVVLGALATMMSLIALFVSCCSFCNQEQDYHGAVVTQQPGYVGPPSMVVAQASNYQQAVPYQHLPQQYPPQQHPTQQYPPQQYLTQQTPLLQQVPPPPYTGTREPRYPVGLDKARLIANEEN